MLKIRCDRCDKQLKCSSALIFSPPWHSTKVHKFHICRSCFKDLTKWIESYEKPDLSKKKAKDGKVSLKEAAKNARDIWNAPCTPDVLMETIREKPRVKRWWEKTTSSKNGNNYHRSRFMHMTDPYPLPRIYRKKVV